MNILIFVQIMEMQDLGNKLRMVVMAHRRIKLLDAVTEPRDVTNELALMNARLASKKLAIRYKTPDMTTQLQSDAASGSAAPSKIYNVNTENLEFEAWETTDEIKAITQEVVKTIRDIIALNPLYRESLQQMFQLGGRVVDNPVYLSDLGAALTAGDTRSGHLLT